MAREQITTPDPVGDPQVASSNLYVTSDQLKATLELTDETFADADVATALIAASRGIEKLCRRRFYADADDTTVRYYTPSSLRLVRLDDLIVLSEFVSGFGQNTFDTTWTENTDFVLEPLNAPADGWPYTRLRTLGWAQRLSPNTRSVRVTGQFGWSEVPGEIVEATGVLAARLLRRAREAPFGVIGFGMDANNAVHLARQDPDVGMLAGPFIRQLVA